jgi:hypothetical protein
LKGMECRVLLSRFENRMILSQGLQGCVGEWRDVAWGILIGRTLLRIYFDVCRKKAGRYKSTGELIDFLYVDKAYLERCCGSQRGGASFLDWGWFGTWRSNLSEVLRQYRDFNPSTSSLNILFCTGSVPSQCHNQLLLKT